MKLTTLLIALLILLIATPNVGSLAQVGRVLQELDRLKLRVQTIVLLFSDHGFSSRARYWRARRGKRTWHAVREGTLKYVARREGDKFEEHLFDLKSDLAE